MHNQLLRTTTTVDYRALPQPYSLDCELLYATITVRYCYCALPLLSTELYHNFIPCTAKSTTVNYCVVLLRTTTTVHYHCSSTELYHNFIPCTAKSTTVNYCVVLPRTTTTVHYCYCALPLLSTEFYHTGANTTQNYLYCIPCTVTYYATVAYYLLRRTPTTTL